MKALDSAFLQPLTPDQAMHRPLCGVYFYPTGLRTFLCWQGDKIGKQQPEEKNENNVIPFFSHIAHLFPYFGTTPEPEYLIFNCSQNTIDNTWQQTVCASKLCKVL